MPSTTPAKQEEIDRNLETFLALEAGLMPQHKGMYALLRLGEVVGLFDNPLDAEHEGARLFSNGLFSIQLIGQDPEDLGLYSHAFDLWAS